MREVTQPIRARGRMLSAVAVVAALAALLAIAPFASATSDPVASGTTSVTLNKGFYKKLKKAGVKVLKVSPAKLKNRKITLPVAGGSMDPTNGLGNLELSGGFKFKRGKKQAPMNKLVLDTAHSALTGKVANKQMKVAVVAGLSFTRNGFGVNVSVAKLKLTNSAVKQLNKKLGYTKSKKGKKSSASVSKKKSVKSPFKKNQVIGGSSSETQPKTVAVLPGGKATLATAEATVKKFVLPPEAGNFVKIEAVTPAEEEKVVNPFTPNLKFPIGGGTIAPDANGGVVQTGGSVKLIQNVEPIVPLIKGTTTMTLSNIWVDLGAKTATVEVTVESTISEKLNLGNLGRSSIANLNLTGATIKSDPSAHTVTVENAVATLQAVTADVLNDVFGTPWDTAKVPHAKFAEGDPLGTFSFAVQTQ